MSKLYVVTCFFNPHRYQSRIRLHKNFEEYIKKTANAQLFTVELAFGDRPFEVTEAGNPFNLQVRSNEELWHKERLLNLGIRRLPSDWEYVAWIDADLIFSRPDWADETLELLQHYPVVQMFSQAMDLSPSSEALKIHQGIVAAYQHGDLAKVKEYDKYHPGFAWAARRETLDSLGGLLDFAVLGSGDRHMALSLLNVYACPTNMTDGYKGRIRAWYDRCRKYVKRNVGYMPGCLIHYWHGKKTDRRYWDRWKILIKNEFDPNLDLKEDTQGLYTLTGRIPQLRYDIRDYFAQRNEDSIDL